MSAHNRLQPSSRVERNASQASRLYPFVLVLSVFLAHCVPVAASQRTVILESPPATAQRYSVFELHLRVENPTARNPFTDVTVTGEFTHGDSDSLTVKGFCDSPDGLVFRVRFCPQEVGEYSFLVTFSDREGNEEFRGSFTSNETGRKGFIRVDAEHPNHFIYENGGHPFICSKTAWVIGDTNNWQGFLDKMVTRKENCIRFGIETNYYHETIGKDVWPWGGTRSNPVLSSFNPAVWQKLERIITYAAERGILSEPVIFCSMRRENPTAPDPDMERYWDYLLARLSPFTSIVTWQLYNEYASAKSYQQYMAEYIRQHDPYGHLICSSAGTTNDALWPTEPWMDIAINHSCTDDTQIESRYHAIGSRIRQYGKPAWCDETGRENRHGNNSGVHRRKQYWTWNICGVYWSYHSWEGCEGIEDLKYNGPGSEFLQFIRSFWERTEWWKMQPADERILNDPASQYEWCLASDTETVVYMVNEATGASTKEGTIELSIGAGSYSVMFYSPATGAYVGDFQRSGYHTGGKLSLPHPAFVDDLVVYVKHDNRAQPVAIPRREGQDGVSLRISWPGASDESYWVECSPDLFQWGDASSLPDYQPPIYHKTGGWSWLDPSWTTVPMRFYRLWR